MVDSADDFELRELTADDGETLRHLVESNPDGGEIQFAPRFKVDPYEMYERLSSVDEQTGFIAETPGGEPAGAGLLQLTEARVGGALRPRGYLAGLVVDHDYRGLGLGKRLAAERVRHAERAAGDDVVVTAAIQDGNDPSMAVARSWADGFPYEFVNHSVELRDDPPATPYEIRSIYDAELGAFVGAINEFYDDAEMWAPYREDRLADLLATEVEGHRVHRCDVVVDDGEFVAGAHVIEAHKLQSTVVTDLPPELEDADELPPSIPDDREIRQTVVVPWFGDGAEAAGEAIVEYERATAGDSNRLMFMFDPEGPLGRLDSLEVDEGTIKLNWAIRGLEDPVEDGFVAPGVG